MGKETNLNISSSGMLFYWRFYAANERATEAFDQLAGALREESGPETPRVGAVWPVRSRVARQGIHRYEFYIEAPGVNAPTASLLYLK